MKECGCRAGGLTKNVTLWECRGCGECQSARRKSCYHPECGRIKPVAPRGYGCCAVTYTSRATNCGDIGQMASEPPRNWDPCGHAFLVEDQAPIPHPEHHYFVVGTDEVDNRGSFIDRRGIERCVGCLAPATRNVVEDQGRD